MKAIDSRPTTYNAYPEKRERIDGKIQSNLVDEKILPLASNKVKVVEEITIVNSGYDLTRMTPSEITTLSAKLYEEGKIEIQQMVRLHAISINYQHPPS
ncbi:MAG: hypothetical protein ACI9ES_001526 [Oceanospirillaceae bacterium]|jgi:hypothetical protein